MNQPSRFLSLLLALSSCAIVACKKESPAEPGAGDCFEPAAAPRNGFFLNGAGYSSAKADLEDGTAGFTGVDVSNNAVGTVFTMFSGSTIGGTDYSPIRLVLHFPGRAAGSFAWNGPTTGVDSSGMTLSIEAGKAAGTYRSVSGTTQVVTYRTVPSDSALLAGKFCGTLKDSTGRTITLTGGRFRVGN